MEDELLDAYVKLHNHQQRDAFVEPVFPSQPREVVIDRDHVRVRMADETWRTLVRR